MCVCKICFMYSATFYVLHLYKRKILFHKNVSVLVLQILHELNIEFV